MTNDAPKIATEGNLEAPFGKRLYDEAVVKKLKGVRALKFWGTLVMLLTITLLLEVATSNRVLKHTARSIEFEATIDKVRVDGDKIIIPPLVLQYRSDSEVLAWAKTRATPIQVLNFVSAKEVPPGSEAKAVLLTGATNGLIKARLAEPVKVDGVSLIDAGVLLMGQGRSTSERLYIDFKKAVYRDGKSVTISAQAYDLSDSIVGLKGSLVGDVALKLAASSGLNFLSGMALGMQAPAYDQFGKPVRPSVGDAALSGVSKAADDQAQTYMQDLKNRPPIIEVKSGTVFIVTFDGGN